MIISNTPPRARWAAWGAVAGLSLILALAGCAPATGNAGGAGDDELKGGSDASYEDWSLAFDACMRDEGIDLQRSDAGAEGSESETSTLDLGDVDLKEFEKAQQKCIKTVGEAPVQEGAATDEEMNEMMLVFARCMREAGYDYPDPQPIDGDNELAPAISAEDVDPAVMDACADEAGLPAAEPAE